MTQGHWGGADVPEDGGGTPMTASPQEVVERGAAILDQVWRASIAVGQAPDPKEMAAALYAALQPGDQVREGLRVIPDAGVWVTPSHAVEEAAEATREACAAYIESVDGDPETANELRAIDIPKLLEGGE